MRDSRVALAVASAWLALVFGSFIFLSVKEQVWPKLIDLLSG